MHIIEGSSIKDTWQTAKTVIKTGKRILDGSEELFEHLDLFLNIKNPEKSSEEDPIEDIVMKTWMMANFQKIRKVPELNNAKSYAWRLYSYNNKDQIKGIINKLKNKPESKSATITTFFPNEDEQYIPCVSLLDFKIRKNTLILTVTCRSLDFGMKALYNLYCLSDILHHVKDKLGIQESQLNVHVISAHIYEKDLK